MKRLFSLLLALIFVSGLFHVHAQDASPFAKGKWGISGMTGFSMISYNTTYDFKNGDNGDKSLMSEEDKTKATKLYLTPLGGYFIMRGLLLGILITMSYEIHKYPLGHKSTTAEYDVNKSLLFAMGPAARYYYDLEGKLKPFGEASVFFGANNDKNQFPNIPDNKTKRSVVGTGLGLGASYFATDFLSVDGQLGYVYSRRSEKLDNGAKNIIKNGGFGFHFGVSVYIGQPKE